ncbi:MAG: alpha/beta fold hydrolase [Gemmatimonas sp.]|nr:alpha/beta fold hydrolase [Gemmatimonas sp.]
MLSTGRTLSSRRLTAAAILFSLVSAAPLLGQDWPATPPSEPPADLGPVSPNLEEIEYPYPVSYLELNRFGQDMRMAYMDVEPAGEPNGQTAVIFHGMNFYGEAYATTINALREEGFRVVALDQIGFGKSTKAIVPYTFSFLAANSKAVLDEIGVEQAAIVGHSMGGMLAARFAMHYPETTTHLVLVNQIGLADSRQSRPWNDPGDGYDGPTDRERAYQSAVRTHTNYYPEWHPPQLEYVRRQFGHTLSGDYPVYSQVRALLGHMVYSDPIVYDWQHIDSKALVIGGADDQIAEDWAGLARNSAEELQNATIILYDGVGHNPQQQIPDQFHSDLIRFLRSDPDQPASEWQ